MTLAKGVGIHNIKVKRNSQLWQAMSQESFKQGTLNLANIRADILSKLASTKKSGNYHTFIQETLVSPNIEVEEVNIID